MLLDGWKEDPVEPTLEGSKETCCCCCCCCCCMACLADPERPTGIDPDVLIGGDMFPCTSPTPPTPEKLGV